MSHGAAKWSALLGVAVTHSPNVGSRSEYREPSFGQPRVLGGTLEPKGQEGGPGGPLPESSGSLYWPARGDTVLPCVAASREMSQVCQ